MKSTGYRGSVFKMASEKIDRDSYLDAVRNVLSTSNIRIGRHLKVSRMTVHRFVNKYPDVLEEAKEDLENLGDLTFKEQYNSIDSFMQIPIIASWIRTLKSDEVTELTERKYITGLHNVCKYLKIHPRKIEPEDCKDLIFDVKQVYNERVKLKSDGVDRKDLPKNIKGLSYLYIRNPIRSFFTVMKNYSSKYLTKRIGLTKEKEHGRYSRQMVKESVRHKLEEILKEICPDYNTYLEVLGADKFMFYSGTRIEATLDFSFRKNEYTLRKDLWLLEVIDKGRKGRKEGGGLKWTKIFMSHALDDLKDYCSKRFKISIENLEKELPEKTAKLFPTITRFIINRINKEGLIKAGLEYKYFEPNHIWRHTFAQCCLRATGWNYELVAELGGWDGSHQLIKSYGSMGTKIRIDGMKMALGLTVEKKEKEYDLRW